MYFVLLAKDGPDSSIRGRERPAHLEYLATRQHLIVYAGPLINDDKVVGSLLIFNVPDRATLDQIASEDPYFRAGLFASVDVYESRWVVPEREPGALLIEAERSRQQSSQV